MSTDELLAPPDLSSWLKIPVATVYRWRYAGGGPPSIKVGRHVRYRRTDVERWLAERTTGDGPRAA